ncbi:MAG TPA: hypothetical protein VGH37_12450 [Candidatus Acidoferrum sp.]|jgi:hypothetical protein
MSEYGLGNKSVEANPLSFGKNSAIHWWPKAIAILGALLLGTGAIIALFHPVMLVSPQDEINGAVHIYAGYVASRNLSLAIMLLAAVGLGAKRMLNSLLLLIALIQLLDGVIDAVEGRWLIVPGVAVLALLFFTASAFLSGYPFWRAQAWKQAD